MKQEIEEDRLEREKRRKTYRTMIINDFEKKSIGINASQWNSGQYLVML